jgi:hypothetical protein
MSEKVERFEPVEDALFALLMEQFMKQQGEALLEENERRKHEPEDAALTASKERCQKAIRRYFKKEAAPKKRKRLKTIGRIIIVAILTMALVSATVFAVSEPARVSVLNLMIDLTDSELTFSSSGSTASGDPQPMPEEDFVLGWMPEGFTETSQHIDDTEIMYGFTNAEGAFINVSELDARYSTLSVSRDNAEVQTMEIGDYLAYLVAYDDICEITWVDEERALIVHVLSEGVDPEITIKIAENISF